MNGLKVCAGDVGNAFLNGKTNEKCYVVAGPEFGPDVQGKHLIIDRSIYGLKVPPPGSMSTFQLVCARWDTVHPRRTQIYG